MLIQSSVDEGTMKDDGVDAVEHCWRTKESGSEMHQVEVRSKLERRRSEKEEQEGDELLRARTLRGDKRVVTNDISGGTAVLEDGRDRRTRVKVPSR